MKDPILLDPIKILFGPKQTIKKDAVLINQGKILSFGEKARSEANSAGISAQPSDHLLIAPCLVDPHSVLEEPVASIKENLNSLINAARQGGYGQIALLPKSKSWRDSPEKLQRFNQNSNDVLIHLWGSFSKEGNKKELAPHANLLENGAIGIAEDDSMLPMALLRSGLMLGEINHHPLLIAPRDTTLQNKGIVRESVEALRGGWMPDPIESETIPLKQLIEIQKQNPSMLIRIMNISTSDSVRILRDSDINPITSVCWWHLIKDQNNLSPSEIGWRINPSIGNSIDRNELIRGIKNDQISAISVNSVALDEDQISQPIEHQLPGLSGHHLVLPSLWQKLVVENNLSIEKLWDALSFGPSKLLNLKPESLQENSRRWLIFNPNESWIQSRSLPYAPIAPNQPLEGQTILGKVIDCGLNYVETQLD